MTAKQPAKRGRGRPATGRKGQRCNVYLPPEVVSKARRLGDGMLSLGLQRAVESVREK